MKRCPNCNQNFSYPDYESDYIHKCNSGSAAIDQDDKPLLATADWNMRGLANKAAGDQLSGDKVQTPTKHGNRDQTHYQDQHSEVVNLK